jgi:outer membrane protein
MFTFGCSGRNAEFGTVDMRKIEAEAVFVKTTQSEVSKRMEELQVEMEKALEGKTTEEQQKVMTEYSAKAQLLQSEAQNKLKSSLDNALHQVAKEKGLCAILYKDAVPQGGTDVTQAVIDKMK